MLRRLQREFVYATCAQAGGLTMTWREFVGMAAVERVGLVAEVERLIERINEANEEAADRSHGTVHADD